MTIRFETLRAADEAARNDLGGMAFGHNHPPVADAHVIAPEHTVAAYDGEELVASATGLPGGHWFGGRPVTGPNIAGVSVAPHRRGQGIAKPLMTEVVRRAHADGAAVSGLYPTTASLYRGAGWELAGEYLHRKIRVETLVDVDVDVEMEPLDIADFGDGATVEAYEALAARGAGHVARGDFWWWRRRSLLEREDKRQFLYRIRTSSGHGYVVLRAVPESSAVFDLELVDIGATDGRTLRALGPVLGRFGTVADTITTHLPPWIVQTWTSTPQAAVPTDGWGWMLRVIDLHAAVAQRGWPQIDGILDLALVDDILDPNTGSWRLHLEGGHARLEPGGAGTWAMDIGAFSSWFTGWTTMSQLLATGRIATPSDLADLALADAATAGPPPTVPEFY